MMVGKTTQLRFVDPVGLSTGGSRTTPLEHTKAAKGLKAIFQKLAPKQKPKVVESEVNRGDVNLRRTGRRATLDLQLLAKMPPKAPTVPQAGTSKAGSGSGATQPQGGSSGVTTTAPQPG